VPTTRRGRPGPGYHSPLRTRQAAQTRQAVLAAATRLFAARGWAGTTLAAVAAEAGTAVETVYAGFGSKSGLLTAAIDAAIAGDDEPVPLAERPRYARMGTGSRRERLSAAANLIAPAHVRSVPLLRALQEAAASDEAAAGRWARYEADRRAEIVHGLGLILGHRPADRLADSAWAIASPEVFAKLVIDRGWPATRYERWLADTVDVMLGTSEG
jgi:AcrR family transcriptional regulator